MIYLSYNYLNSKEHFPYWMAVFSEFCRDKGIPFFVTGEYDKFENLGFSCLTEEEKTKLIINNMDKALAGKPDSDIVKGRLFRHREYGKVSNTFDSLFLNLYALLRSDVVLYNLDPSTEMHDVIVASMFNIPTLGITDSYVNNPFSFFYDSIVMSPKEASHIYTVIKGLTNGKEQ